MAESDDPAAAAERLAAALERIAGLAARSAAADDVDGALQAAEARLGRSAEIVARLDMLIAELRAVLGR